VSSLPGWILPLVTCTRMAACFLALLAGAALRADQVVQVGPGTTFTPSTVTVAPGEMVTWSFANLHTSTSDSATGPEVWDSGFVSSGTFSHTFHTPGDYPYYCQVTAVVARDLGPRHRVTLWSTLRYV
jgi:plastocyanin